MGENTLSCKAGILKLHCVKRVLFYYLFTIRTELAGLQKMDLQSRAVSFRRIPENLSAHSFIAKEKQQLHMAHFQFQIIRNFILVSSSCEYLNCFQTQY